MKKIIIILGIIIIIASACTQGNVNKQATLTIADNFDSTVVVCTDSIDEQIIINGSDTKAIIEDFNNDGFRDTLTSFYDGGSGFGGNYIVLISGKTKERFELDDYGCFCDIKQIVLIPPELRKTSNKLFLETIKKELLPKKMNLPDASLQWLITANMNSKRLSDNIYDLVINTPTQWISGEIKLPDTYYIDIKGDTLDRLFYTDFDIPKWYNSKSNEGCLVYYGHNHFRNEKGDSLILVDSSPTYQVFQTSHGIVVKKDNSYAWVFITDYRLTGAPEKLRWESIGKIKLFDKHIVIQLINSNEFSNPIFIIDIEKGISGRLRYDNDYSNSYTIDKDKIIIENNIGTKSYELEKLFNELNKQ